MISFSTCINHTPFRPERVRSLKSMKAALTWSLRAPTFINDKDYRGTEWQVSKVEWFLTQLRWAADQKTSHAFFMTDDLHIAPRFWEIATRMVEHVPDRPIGFLSNAPRGPELVAKGAHWYRSNSWAVGPCMLFPTPMVREFLRYYEALSFEQQAYANDDSSWNSWITEHGPGETYHPLPTIIEHRADLASTVGHGDQYSRERVSWREMRVFKDGWQSWGCAFDVDALCSAEWWQTEAPMLAVGE